MFRVLRLGAHFCVSDIVATGELGEPIRKAAALHVGCVAGAIPLQEYLRLIEDAGFGNVEVVETKIIELADTVLARHIDTPAIAAFGRSGVSLQSVTVRANKPAPLGNDALAP
jgi:hypothetical protein